MAVTLIRLLGDLSSMYSEYVMSNSYPAFESPVELCYENDCSWLKHSRTYCMLRMKEYVSVLNNCNLPIVSFLCFGPGNLKYDRTRINVNFK